MQLEAHTFLELLNIGGPISEADLAMLLAMLFLVFFSQHTLFVVISVLNTVT